MFGSAMTSKAKKLAKRIELLSAHEQEVVKGYFKSNPEKVWGEQKSLLKGHSDLPLFRSVEEQKQTNLFE